MVSTRSGAVTTPAKPVTTRSTPAKPTTRSRKSKGAAPLKSTAWLALGDGVATLTFVLLASLFNEAALVLSYATSIPLLASNLMVIVLGVLLHTPICSLVFSGALYNPSHNVAMYINGLGTLQQHACRVAAQIGGGILGSTLAIVLIPDHLQRSFAGFGLGVRPGVHLWQGLVCELALALILNVIVLWSFSAANAYVAYWTLMGATLVLVVAGAELTGPSMNPAISVGWFFHFQGHPLLEHVLVFWVAPLAGGMLAGLVWRALASKPTKKAPKRKTT